MKERRYLILYASRTGDKFCKVVKAYTMFEACQGLPFGSKLKAVTLL